MRKFILGFLLVLAFSSFLAAEWTEGLRVVVTDLNGYPAANIAVKVEYQKNTFLSLETISETPPLGTEYECPAGLGGVSSIVIDNNTGVATVTYSTTSGGCGSLGQTFISAGNQTPSNLTTDELGTGEVDSPPEEEEVEQNFEPSDVVITITRFNLDDVDGRIDGKTDRDGVFETSVRNQVPDANATNEYLVTVGGEKRRVRYGDNFINGRHVESFTVKSSLSLIPVRVVDAYGVPLEDAFVQMSCSDTKNTTSNVNGYAYIYTKSGCAVSAQYGVYKGTQAIKFVAEPVVALNVSRTNKGIRLRLVDDRGKLITSNATKVFINGEALVFVNGTTYAPAGVQYGGTAVAKVVRGNYSLTKGMLVYGQTRFSLPSNPMVTVRIPNFNNSLTVTVVDENGAPFANALVSVAGRSEQTAPDGSVHFDEIYNDTANVTVFALGVEKSRKVSLEGKETAIIMEFRRNPLFVETARINHTFDKGCRVNLVAVVNDPRMKRQGDITLTATYSFRGNAEQSKQLLVSANGTTGPLAIPCAGSLPATLEYSYLAIDQYGNYTSPKMSYTVTPQGGPASAGEAVGQAVDSLTEITGSETNALVIVTVIMVALIIVLSVAALTALANRGKAKDMGPAKRDAPPPKIPPI